MKIRFSFNIEEMPKWYYRLFRHQHEFEDGSKTSWIQCLKCGRTLDECQEDCQHTENYFGLCTVCNKRVSKSDCEHKEWNRETEPNWCTNCGEDEWE